MTDITDQHTPKPGVTSLTVEEDEAGMRLDRWFKLHFPELAFGHLQKLLRTGQVRVNGGRVKADTRLEQWQAVRIPPLGTTPAGAAPGAPNRPGAARGISAPMLGKGARKGEIIDDASFLRSITLYEDRDVFVFNKPHGLAVQGGSGLSRHIDGMLEVMRDAKGQRPRLVHRLDRETAGCLLVAKTRFAATALTGAFRHRSARKPGFPAGSHPGSLGPMMHIRR